jgi:hypothetical protein
MKYFIDTEFVEGVQSTMFCSARPTIDLISIGLVAEDGRKYYGISKDFNLEEAWDRYEIKDGKKVYWLRQNVLRPIWIELEIQYLKDYNPVVWIMNQDADWAADAKDEFFVYGRLRYVLDKYGKSNKQIAEEIKEFIYNQNDYDKYSSKFKSKPEFYGYYSDYDWVVFCWLFGKMNDLPNGFPKYCRDLQQIFDEKKGSVKGRVKDLPGYPVNKGIHNALNDAEWTYELYKFLKTI